jgi:hypothetical protein
MHRPTLNIQSKNANACLVKIHSSRGATPLPVPVARASPKSPKSPKCDNSDIDEHIKRGYQLKGFTCAADDQPMNSLRKDKVNCMSRPYVIMENQQTINLNAPSSLSVKRGVASRNN